MTTEQELPVEDLVTKLIEAKAAEADANARRIEIESEIIARLGSKEEGSQTHELTNGFKITITGKMTYSADMPLLMQLAGALPENLRPIKMDPKLDDTGAKYLRMNKPEIWRMIAPAITIKPAKTSLTIKA